MRVRAVIFDFDGPICDSFREGIRRIKLLCAIHDVHFGREERRRLTELWGLPGKELLEQGVGVFSHLLDTMYKEWEQLDLHDPVPLVPAAKEVLYWLRKNKFVSTILTTRNTENLMEIFDRLDLAREFDVISARQDTIHRKPDPRAFSYTLETLYGLFGITKEQCIFVGDTPTDIVAGLASGIETLVVQTGPYLLKHVETHPIKLQNLLTSIDDLPGWLEEHHEGEIRHEYQ
ncbi:MAG: HAD-IA family hydrolase [Candidatus Sungbacteria bacterium]|nr:HAD-IA family hydrolase [bacterium]MDZ4285647.1 HAD-IA family hydrolase [Candidatus Sungbacteria bacterium]